MTAYQLFRGLTGVDGELLAAAELVDSRKELAPKKLPARKSGLLQRSLRWRCCWRAAESPMCSV